MQGKKIQQTVDMLQLFMRSLPENCLFNIVTFSHVFKFMFEKSVQYSQETFSLATEKV